MIEGLKIRVTHSELVAHCKERAAYHQRRADEKDAELPGLKDSMEKIKAGGAAVSVAHMNKSNYRLDTADVIESLENDIKDHRNKSLVFAFLAEHFFPEDYTLMETDLLRLEILKRW